MIRRTFLAAIAALWCAASQAVDIEVSNRNDFSHRAVVATDAPAILSALSSKGFFIQNEAGEEIPSQITDDGKLLFMAQVPARGSALYRVIASDSIRSYSPVACGRIYPERADDVAWENETCGYRAYGPATQRKGEKGYGYDIFFKHTGPEPVLERLYAAELNPANWAKLDSLRSVSKELADEFYRTFSYHVDYGLGMDCYAVGPTLGAGVAAPLTDGGELSYPWCYEEARIIDNGPLRFTVELDFAPRAVGNNPAVTETRRITLDAGALLNRCTVRYTGLAGSVPVAVGFPLRDESGTVAEMSGLIAYSDPTQGEGNGRAYLGIVSPAGFGKTAQEQGHILGVTEIEPDSALDYYWGAVWSENNPDITLESWADTLRKFAAAKPLEVTISK